MLKTFMALHDTSVPTEAEGPVALQKPARYFRAVRITVLASGSRGNATLVEHEGAAVLIDAGLNPKTVRRRMKAALGFVRDALDGVVVTHAHGDHVAHATTICRSFKTPLFVSEATAGAREFGPDVKVRTFRPLRRFRLGGLVFEPFPVPHDVPQVALIFGHKKERAALVTDLGEMPKALLPRLSRCRAVLIESNHDPHLLAAGPYPYFLKKRVRSGHGHLSNEQTAQVLATLGTVTKEVVLMHLSEANNRVDLALAKAKQALPKTGVRLRAASQSTPLVVGRKRRAEQLFFAFGAPG